jgi:intraflagellar transport protein 57
VSTLNRRQQFLDMLLLCEFLLNELNLGRHLDVAQLKTETPNAIATALLNAMQAAEFDASKLASITPMSLTPGFGFGVVDIVEFLVDKCLTNSNFEQPQILRTGEDADDDDGGDQQAEPEEEESDIEDEIDDAQDQEDSGDNNKYGIEESKDDVLASSMRAMVVSNLDKHEWRIELERVGPRLKTKEKGGGGWQERIGVMHFHNEKLSEKESGNHLTGMDAIARNLKTELERLERGQGMLNKMSTTERLREMHVEASQEGPATEELLSKISELNAERAAALADVSEEYSEVKDTLNSKGENLSDSKMVVEMKKHVKLIQVENVELEVRLGVVMSTLWGGSNAAASKNKGGGKTVTDGEMESSIGSDEVVADFDNDSIAGGGDSITTAGGSIAGASITSIHSGSITSK